MKGLLHLPALGSGMTVLLMELTILPCIVWFRCHGYRLWLSQHWVSLYFHQYASRICGVVGVPDVECRPFVSSSSIPVCLSFGLLQGVHVIGVNFGCLDEIRSLRASVKELSFHSTR